MKAIEAAFNTEMGMPFGTRPEDFVWVLKGGLISRWLLELFPTTE